MQYRPAINNLAGVASVEGSPVMGFLPNGFSQIIAQTLAHGHELLTKLSMPLADQAVINVNTAWPIIMGCNYSTGTHEAMTSHAAPHHAAFSMCSCTSLLRQHCTCS